MKKVILNIFFLLAITTVANAQVGVGIETDAVADRAILDFPQDAKKGILLPRVTDKTTAGTEPGTFVYDVNTHKVQFYGYDKSDSAYKWIELTPDANTTALNGDLNPSNVTDNSKGAVIEDGTSNETAPEGVLSLESNNRALALPVVEDATKLPSPKAGLICYDKKSKSLAIFNGTKWYFWR